MSSAQIVVLNDVTRTGSWAIPVGTMGGSGDTVAIFILVTMSELLISVVLLLPLCRHYVNLPPRSPVRGEPGVPVVVHTEAGLQGEEHTQPQNHVMCSLNATTAS